VAAVWQRGRHQGAFVSDTLGHRGVSAALHLNIGPARLGDTADALDHLLHVSRGVEQGQFALRAKLVLMGLHAQEAPTFPGCYGAAELL
jgi:hypothetical protein